MPRRVLWKRCSYKFRKIHRKAPVTSATLLKKRLWHRCFPVNFAKFLRTPFFTEHLWWLLLIKSTRTWCEICSKLTIKKPGLFFYCWLWTCTCMLGSYLHFYCLGDFHYLDHFHWLHNWQENWNLVYILKLD